MTNENEIWKDVVGYEGYYIVNNIGVVKSLDRVVPDKRLGKRNLHGEVLKSRLNVHGYECYQLWRNKIGKNKFGHRLVAEAFIPNEFNKTDVNHINGIRNDNRLINLEWATRSENCLHGFRVNGRKSSKNVGCKGGVNHYLSKKVMCVETSKIYDTVSEAATVLKLQASCISLVCNGKRKKTGRMTFRYI